MASRMTGAASKRQRQKRRAERKAQKAATKAAKRVRQRARPLTSRAKRLACRRGADV